LFASADGDRSRRRRRGIPNAVRGGGGGGKRRKQRALPDGRGGQTFEGREKIGAVSKSKKGPGGEEDF